MPERDEHGRFVKGGAPGPGRPKRATEAEYIDAIMTACTLEYWQGIVRIAVRDALKGDRFAREWLANYLIGRPPTVIDLHTADAALLAQLLKRFEAHGMSASEVFDAMLQEFAEESETITDERA